MPVITNYVATVAPSLICFIMPRVDNAAHKAVCQAVSPKQCHSKCLQLDLVITELFSFIYHIAVSGIESSQIWSNKQSVKWRNHGSVETLYWHKSTNIF